MKHTHETRARRATATLDEQLIAIAGRWNKAPDYGLQPQHFPDPSARALFELVESHRSASIGEDSDRLLIETELDRRDVAQGVCYLKEVLAFAICEAPMREHELEHNAIHLKRCAEGVRLRAELEGARGLDDYALEAVLTEKLAALESGEKRNGELVIIRASELQERPVDWLWKGFFGRGMLNLLASAPKSGKSTLMADIAARVTMGSLWPHGLEFPSQPMESAPKGDVLFVCYEDDIERTVIPRLKAAGADLERITFVKGVKRLRGKRETVEGIDLAEHFPQIEELVRRTRPVLVIIDPVMSGFGAGRDTNADNEVRAVLGPYVGLAEETRTAFVFVTHTNKRADASALDSAIGSRAFTGLCRAALAVERFKLPDGTRRSVLLQSGVNLAAPRNGIVFEIKSRDANEARAYVEYVEEYEGDADEFRAEQRKQARQKVQGETETRQGAANDAMLEAVKSHFWIPSIELNEELKVLGHSARLIARARTELVRNQRLELKRSLNEWWTGLYGTVLQGVRHSQKCFVHMEHMRSERS
jgi:putative DNA primase/helicase